MAPSISLTIVDNNDGFFTKRSAMIYTRERLILEDISVFVDISIYSTAIGMTACLCIAIDSSLRQGNFTVKFPLKC